jgi:LysR family transcriptional regulator, benzoate and cis,cis-muconate-responsive activator of ben and cat genes
MRTGLRERRLHLAFAVLDSATPMRGFRFVELMAIPLRLAVAPGHPLGRRKVVPLCDVVREPFIAYSRADYPDYHDSLSKLFGPVRAQPRIVEEHDGVSSLVAAVSAGSGVAIVPATMAALVGKRLILVPITPEPAPLQVGLVVSKSSPSPGVESFLEAARGVASNS